MRAVGGPALHIQVKYRGSAAWTESAVRDLLLPPAPEQGRPRKPPAALIAGEQASYLFITNQSVNSVFSQKWSELDGNFGGLNLSKPLEATLQDRAKAWASHFDIPAPSEWSPKFAAYPQATEGVVRQRVLELLTSVGYVPPAHRAACLEALRRLIWHTFRQRDTSTRAPRTLSRHQIVQEIQNHRGSPDKSPTLRNYVVPPWAEEAEQTLRERGRLIITGPSGVGKTSLMRWLVDRWRRPESCGLDKRREPARVVSVVDDRDLLEVERHQNVPGPLIVEVHDPWGDRDDRAPRLRRKEFGRLLAQELPDVFIVAASPSERVPQEGLEDGLIFELNQNTISRETRRQIFAKYAEEHVVEKTDSSFFDIALLPEQIKLAAHAQTTQLGNEKDPLKPKELVRRSSEEGTRERIITSLSRPQRWHTLEASLLLALTNEGHLEIDRVDLLQRSLQRDIRLARCLPFALVARLVSDGVCEPPEEGRIQLRRSAHTALSSVATGGNGTPRDVDGLPLVVELLVDRDVLSLAADALLHLLSRDNETLDQVEGHAKESVARYLDGHIVASTTPAECGHAWRRRACLPHELSEAGLILHALAAKPRGYGPRPVSLGSREWRAPTWAAERRRRIQECSVAISATRQVIATGVLTTLRDPFQKTRRMPSFLAKLGWDLKDSWLAGLTVALENADRTVEAYVVGALGHPPTRWHLVFTRIEGALNRLDTRHAEVVDKDDQDVAWDEWQGDRYADESWGITIALEAFAATFWETRGGDKLVKWAQENANIYQRELRQALLRYWRNNSPSAEQLNWACKTWEPDLDGVATWEVLNEQFPSQRKRPPRIEPQTLLSHVTSVPADQTEAYLAAVRNHIATPSDALRAWNDLELDLQTAILLALVRGEDTAEYDDWVQAFQEAWKDAWEISDWLSGDTATPEDSTLQKRVAEWRQAGHRLSIDTLRVLPQSDYSPGDWQDLFSPSAPRLLDALDAVVARKEPPPVEATDSILNLLTQNSWEVRRAALAALGAHPLDDLRVAKIAERLASERSKHVRIQLSEDAKNGKWHSAAELLANWAVSDRTDWEADPRNDITPDYRVARRAMEALGCVQVPPAIRKTLRNKWTPASVSDDEEPLAEQALSVLLTAPTKEDIKWLAEHLCQRPTWKPALAAATDIADRHVSHIDKLRLALLSHCQDSRPKPRLFTAWGVCSHADFSSCGELKFAASPCACADSNGDD